MATTTRSKMLNLTPLDLIMPATYTRLLMSFPSDETPGFHDAVVKAMQVGIDNIVSQMPFLAGIVHPCDDASKTGRFHVQYSSDSPSIRLAVQHLASFPHTYSALSSAKMPLDHLENRFAPVGVFADPLTEPCPVFAVQVTFIPGGLFLCVCVHHYLMDGTGFGTFLKMLAESCRTGGGYSMSNAIEIQDRNPCQVGLQSDEPPKTHPEYKIAKLDAEPASNSQPTPPPPQMTTRLFRFSSSSLSALKSDIATHVSVAASSTASSTSYVSTNDCLTALLWTSITRARLPHLTSSSSRLGMAVNARRHLPISADYLGNVNLFATSSLPVSTLAEDSISSLATGALSVREAINEIDAHHIRSAISLINAQQNVRSIGYGFESFLGPDLAVTSWESMPAYDCDWGVGIGRPEWVRTVPSGYGFDGLAIVLPRRRAGQSVAEPTEGDARRELEVMLGLRADDMASLERDAVWTRYCDGVIS